MRRHWRSVAAAIFAAALEIGGLAQSPGIKEKKMMEGIMVTAAPARAAVLPGESLIIKSTVQNKGNASLNVPSDQAASPLSYHLQSEGQVPSAYDASWDLYETQTRIGLAPAHRLEINEDLPPGGVQMREEDIALYNTQPFAIGKYRLTAVWTQGDYQAVSGFTRVVVGEPKIVAWASEMSRRTEELRSVFAHRREDGETVIYERCSNANRPEFGVFRPRVRLGKKEAVTSVAPSAVLNDSGQGLWLAWIAANKLGVASALANEVMVQPPAQTAGVADARVVAPGFQLGPETAAFFVAGRGPGGTALELWAVNGNALKRLWQAPLGPAAGIRILARNGQESPMFVVVFEERQGTAGKLWRRDYDMHGARGDARLLAEFSHPLLAWYVESTDYPSPARLVAVHHGEGLEEVQVREVDLEGKGAAAPTNLPRLTGSPDLWAVASFDNRLHVVAREAGKILYSESGWTAWKNVGASAPGPGWLHLFSPHSIKLWAEWCVADRGPLRTQLLQTRDAID